MNRTLHRILLPCLSLGSLLWLTGCYTQLATTRDEGTYDYYATDEDTTGDNYEQAYADSNDNGYYDENPEVPGYRYGFDYYYPTVGLGFSDYDPWYWRYNGWYYYDPFICGTYYPSIYAGWYPYWPYPGYYFYYPYYHNHTYAGTLGRGGYGGVRTIGSTRGGSAVRGGGEGGYRGSPASGTSSLPTGYRSSSGTRSNPPAATPGVSTGRRSNGARGGSAVRPGSRGGTTRSGSGREATRGQAPRTYTPPRNTGGSGRSYSPPPPPPPAQSTPPSSGGGRSSSGSGGGGGRGGRR